VVKRAGDVAAEQAVQVRAGDVVLEGNLAVPAGARGLVLFAHGSGSSRHSSRNRAVAGVLRDAGLGTLLFDLLTAEEERVDARTAHLRFDIPLLAERVAGVTSWLRQYPQTRALRVGYFGASTGAAAALVAAARQPEAVAAVVSRGGRPDLAGEDLPRVQAPTLLIVGGNDIPVIPLNRQAYEQLGAAVKELVIVPGASHLFEEPGTLEQVARLASEWLTRHLGAAQAAGA
jgi:dienelactone hydrolase